MRGGDTEGSDRGDRDESERSKLLRPAPEREDDRLGKAQALSPVSPSRAGEPPAPPAAESRAGTTGQRSGR